MVTTAYAVPITINDSSYLSGYYESENVNNDYSLYMIGVYQTTSDRGFREHPTGTANVNIGDQFGKNTILVLSSYEPTDWIIHGDGVDDLSQIILLGYHDQSISGYEHGTDISEYSYYGTNNYRGINYYWPSPGEVCRDRDSVSPIEYSSNQRICRAQDVTAFIEGLVGTEITTFAGSYRATQFSIGENVAVSVFEPSSLVLLLMGLGLLARRMRA